MMMQEKTLNEMIILERMVLRAIEAMLIEMKNILFFCVRKPTHSNNLNKLMQICQIKQTLTHSLSQHVYEMPPCPLWPHSFHCKHSSHSYHHWLKNRNFLDWPEMGVLARFEKPKVISMVYFTTTYCIFIWHHVRNGNGQQMCSDLNNILQGNYLHRIVPTIVSHYSIAVYEVHNCSIVTNVGLKLVHTPSSVVSVFC